MKPEMFIFLFGNMSHIFFIIVSLCFAYQFVDCNWYTGKIFCTSVIHVAKLCDSVVKTQSRPVPLLVDQSDQEEQHDLPPADLLRLEKCSWMWSGMLLQPTQAM